MDTDGLFIDKASVSTAVLVDKVQGVAREVVSVTARFAFDEVSVLVSCGSTSQVSEDNNIE